MPVTRAGALSASPVSNETPDVSRWPDAGVTFVAPASRRTVSWLNPSPAAMARVDTLDRLPNGVPMGADDHGRTRTKQPNYRDKLA